VIIFTNHALEKLAQRGITRRFVERALQHPDRIEPARGKRKAAYRKFRARVLKVIFTEERTARVVITEYWVDTPLT